MKIEAATPFRHYSPRPPNSAYAPIIKLHNGPLVWNLMWLSLEFDERGLTELSGTHADAPRMVWRTLNHDTIHCEYRNPYEHGQDSNLSQLMLHPPEMFVEWLNKLSQPLRCKLPLYQHRGEEWVATVNRRLELCNPGFDTVNDVSLAQAALAKFTR